MKKSILVLLLGSFVFSFTLQADAKAKPKNPPPHIAREIEQRQNAATANGEDADLVDAVNNRRRLNFVAGAGLLVVKVLPDDTNGREHQKWVVQLSNGKLVQAVYNSDMCPRVPVEVGDVVDMGGEFIWTPKGGLLHWLHHDPRGNRPDGYVILDGKKYCND